MIRQQTGSDQETRYYRFCSWVLGILLGTKKSLELQVL
jgi:hypothetical protein